jgi:2-methylisocitrate lyase-like PEP mutase family enzyme
MLDPEPHPMTDVTPYAERRRKFRALHESGCLLLPNPWDAGGAVRLQKLGFQALASSSSACALALGRTDYQITLEESLAHLALLVRATDLPVNADFENGFAAEPAQVAVNVRRAIATGIAAARVAIRDSGEDVVLVARTECYLAGRPDPRETIARLERFAAAGADCLYAPGVTDLAVIADIVRAAGPKPVNVLLYGGLRVPDLARIGVRRISLGGALAAASWQAFDAAARSFLESRKALGDR